MNRPRNPQATALRHRAGNAGVAVAVDTRPKVVPNRKKANTRKADKAALRQGAWS